MIDVAVTEHAYSQMVCRAFAQGCDGNLVPPNRAGPFMACYGILRGCGEAMRKADEYFYIDHGFFNRAAPAEGDGHYRVIHNNLWPPSTPDGDWTRYNKLAIDMKPRRKTGSHIVVVPPSPVMSQFLALEGWLDSVLLALDQLTDRPVFISNKHERPAHAMFEDAWCIVTEHSQVAIDAMVEGIPAIMLSPVRANGDLKQIEDPPYNTDFFSRLANCQWTLDEMLSGECWAALQRERERA